MKPVLVSACLLGLKTRYDGCSRPAEGFLPEETLPVPVCAEILGGLSTPRPASWIVDGTGADVLDGRCRMVNEEGRDVTAAFIRGAEAVLRIALITGADEAYLKSRSPSCDVGFGVTAAMLARHGIRVYDVD